MGNPKQSTSFQSNNSDKLQFWVINISNQNVSLRDLGITIPAGKSYDLLNPKFCCLTLEQIIQSVDSGSIYLKRNKIKFRDPPTFHKFTQNLPVSSLIQERRRTSLMTVDNHDTSVLPDFDQDQAFSDQKFIEEFIED